MSNILRIKCLVIGDSVVGKTSIVRALTANSGNSNQFSNKYLMTKDIEISSKILNVMNSQQTIELFLYDCSGKQFYQQIIEKVSTNQISAIVAVFDVTNEQTFNGLHKWLSETLKTIGKQEKVIGIIFGNKIDLKERIVVSSDGAHSLAKKYKMRYFESSAKQIIGIEEAFHHLTNTFNETRNNQKSYNTLKED